MVFEETFFESVVHGVNGSFALLVAVESVEVRFLNEKQDE